MPWQQFQTSVFGSVGGTDSWNPDIKHIYFCSIVVVFFSNISVIQPVGRVPPVGLLFTLTYEIRGFVCDTERSSKGPVLEIPSQN